MLDIAPAIDLAEHRTEAAVCGVHPIFQRAHRAGAEGRDASDGDGTFDPKLAVEDEANASFHEVDLLDVEANQRTTAKTGGGQQQQGPIAQAGEVARTGGCHANEAGCRWRRCAPTCGVAAGLPQQRCHRRIGCGRGEPVLAMLGGDGSSAACQCASAEPPTERRKVVSDGGRDGRQRHGAGEPAPSNERRPVTCIEPQGFGGRRTPERRRSGLDITAVCRAVCSRLMCLGVHTPPCRSMAAGLSLGPRHANPSDSRHLLEFGQALLRRGKQVFAGAYRAMTRMAFFVSRILIYQ